MVIANNGDDMPTRDLTVFEGPPWYVDVSTDETFTDYVVGPISQGTAEELVARWHGDGIEAKAYRCSSFEDADQFVHDFKET